MKAVQINQAGGPEDLLVVDLPDPVPGDGQVVIRHEAVGLNFIDIYQRSGIYPVKFPAVLGSEGAGVVVGVGAGVTRFKIGDRVAYGTGAGAYAQMIALPEGRVVALPPDISTRTAAAAMLKGMTAEFLTRIWPLEAGDAVLVHAAAGGVGAILTQWLKHLGLHVIGVVGSEAKAAYAASRGCDHVILSDREDIAARVRSLTNGVGVKVVYDSVGKATFEASLASVARRGLFVSFGNASGPVEPFAPLRLSQAGSIYLTRPTLFDYVATPEALDQASAALFKVIASGVVVIDIAQEWPLTSVSDAHRALASRATTGASLLIP